MSAYRPPGTFGVLRLLAVASLKRLLRAAQIAQNKRARQQDGKRSRRTATRRKGGGGLMWLIVLMMPIFLFQAVFMSAGGVAKMRASIEQVVPGNPMVVASDFYWETKKNFGYDEARLGEMLDQHAIDEDSRPSRSQIVEHWREHGADAFRSAESVARPRLMADAFDWSDEGRSLFVRCSAVLLFSLVLMCLFTAFGGANATLAGGEWTQVWLLTFPVPTRALVLARAFEYALVQFFPWLTLMPLSWQVLRALGQEYALVLAVVGTLSTTALVGAVRLWLETLLRLKFSLVTLRNIQGACTILALLTMGLVFSMVLGPAVPFVFVDVCAVLPDACALLPGAWPLALAGFGPVGLVAGPGISVAVFLAAVVLTSRLLRGGAMRTGGVDPGSRGRAGAWRRARGIGVIGKDVLLLLRDRNLMVQTLLVPVFIIGLQLLINPAFQRVDTDGIGTSVAVIAYFVGAYGSLNGCLQVLSGEGRALWMLYTLPVSIGEVLRRKTRMWAGVAVGFGWLALVLMALRGDPFDWATVLFEAAFVGVGVFCAAHIGAAVGVIGANPTSDHVPKQPKARHVYLFLFFMTSYVVTLLAPTAIDRLAGVVTFATLAYAFWQRAQERLQWLLDPVDEPRRHLTLFDAASALVVFGLLMALILLVMRGDGANLAGRSVAFAISGGVTLLAFGVGLRLRGVAILRAFGLRAPVGVALLGCVAGASLGAAIGGLGLAYVHYLREFDVFDFPEIAADDRTTMLWLAVVAAPIVEELLFRGMLFGGLVRSVRPAIAAIWSALLFMSVHPVHSWVPVFVLGWSCALLFRRVGFLPAAMLMHATYNAVVVTLQ